MGRWFANMCQRVPGNRTARVLVPRVSNNRATSVLLCSDPCLVPWTPFSSHVPVLVHLAPMPHTTKAYYCSPPRRLIKPIVATGVALLQRPPRHTTALVPPGSVVRDGDSVWTTATASATVTLGRQHNEGSHVSFQRKIGDSTKKKKEVVSLRRQASSLLTSKSVLNLPIGQSPPPCPVLTLR